jgi:hypothetical protein
MLALFGIELPDLPPAEDQPIDSHVMIPIGGLVADLDFKLRRQREDIIEAARRLGSRLMMMADSLERDPKVSVSANGAIGDAGASIDRICASHHATRELRREIGRVAFQRRQRVW